MNTFDKLCESILKSVDTSIDYDPNELAKGIKVEKEHTTDESTAEIIAKQHLAEDPEYYSNLEKIHKEDRDVRKEFQKVGWCIDKKNPKKLHPKGHGDCADEEEEGVDELVSKKH